MVQSSQKSIDEVLSDLTELKLFPPAAQKILRLANNPAANLRSIEQAVKLDPVLTGRVLKIANSAYYGAPNRIATLGQALGVMGFQPAREMAVALAIGSLQSGKAKDSRDLWAHSIKTALASRLLGRYVSRVDNNALFIAGLLHDIGQTVMKVIFPESYELMSARFQGDYAKLVKAEHFKYKFDHAELGARCLEMWNLPETTVEIVRRHHYDSNSMKTKDPIQRAVLVLICSEQLVLKYDEGLRQQDLIAAATAQQSFAYLGLTAGNLDIVVELMAEEFVSLSTFN